MTFQMSWLCRHNPCRSEGRINMHSRIAVVPGAKYNTDVEHVLEFQSQISPICIIHYRKYSLSAEKESACKYVQNESQTFEVR